MSKTNKNRVNNFSVTNNSDVDHSNSNNEFDKIWEFVVLPLSKTMSEKYELKLKNKNIFKFRARRLYNKYREEFLKYYMHSKTNNIDKHKIASCLTKTILMIKPISIPFNVGIKIRFSNESYQNKKYMEEILLINQYLALSIATSVIEDYIKAHNTHNDVSQPLNHKIEFPTPFSEADNDYLRDVCLDLYYTKPRKFNTITYANIFFLWEKYSCRKVQCMNLEESYKALLLNPGYYKKLQDKSEQEINKIINNIKYKQHD